MTTNEILMLLGGIAISCSVLALLLVLYPRLKTSSGNVVQAAAEAALQPIITDAILAAYRLSETSVDAGLQRLRGPEKKELADSVYRMLPERIGEFGVTFVKSLITQERFRVLVQDRFDGFDRFYLLNHAHFDGAFRKWSEQHKATPPAEIRADEH